MQNMPPEDLPFAPILVDVSKDVLLPHYAAVKRNYDIAPYRNGQRQGPPMPVDITTQWRPYNIGMDSTQVDALKTMLSNNIAIVQGKILLEIKRSYMLNIWYARSSWYWQDFCWYICHASVAQQFSKEHWSHCMYLPDKPW